MNLENCPFCGGTEITMNSNRIGDYFVECGEPSDEESRGCHVRSDERHCESQRQAAERWNRRAFSAKAVKEEMEGLRTALEKIHSWLVCSAITTPEDMAQSFAEMEETARLVLFPGETTEEGNEQRND